MVKDRSVLSKSVFYILSWTWGIVLNLIGAIVVGVIVLYKFIRKQPCKLKKLGYCYYLEVGETWGGLELGMFFLVGSKCGTATKWHEHGHGVQNCFWGILFIPVIWIPSAIRYWYRHIRYTSKGIKAPTSYDSIWFEGDASAVGRKYKSAINA